MARKEPLIDWKKIGAIMHKNLTVLLRDKTRVIPLLMFPIFMIVVFGYTSGNIPKHIPTALVIYDESPLSQELQQAISDNQVFAIRYVVSTEGEAKKLLDRGAVRVIIEIPAGLEKNLDTGTQSSVTVIVDESDAAVASTAHNTLSTIIDRFASKLGERKLIEFQQSVAAGSGKLSDFIAAQPDTYASILVKTSATESILSQIKASNELASRAALLAAPAPSLYIAPQSENQNSSGNNTLAAENPGATSAKAQASGFQKTATLATTAQTDVRAASAIAEKAAQQTAAMHEYQAYDTAVLAPLRDIQVFTSTRASSILRPVTYEEKAGYGTGKRAVDFLIPAIIALTIFQGAVMGMGRAVAGEKREGSLTRVFLTPTSTATIVLGTLLFYIIFELFRSAFLISIAILLFNVKIEGSLLLIALILVIYTGIPTSIGMILSSAVRTEGQYMAMAMLVSMPMIFLAGVFFPLQALPGALRAFAEFLPVTYAGDALRGVMIKGLSIQFIILPLIILLIFLAVFVTMLFVVFKRDIE